MVSHRTAPSSSQATSQQRSQFTSHRAAICVPEQACWERVTLHDSKGLKSGNQCPAHDGYKYIPYAYGTKFLKRVRLDLLELHGLIVGVVYVSIRHYIY